MNKQRKILLLSILLPAEYLIAFIVADKWNTHAKFSFQRYFKTVEKRSLSPHFSLSAML